MDLMSLFQTRSAIWATRDGCLDHYPHRCPKECPNAGRHDSALATFGLCECVDCYTPPSGGDL